MRHHPRPRPSSATTPQVSLLEGMRISIRWCLERGQRLMRCLLIARSVLVTGGSGYFGAVARGATARPTATTCASSISTRPRTRASSTSPGDVRDPDAVRAACAGVDVVLHNVAQVPLARDRHLFWSVNVTGTANVLVAARDAGVSKVVSTSSSAIFGIPESNPVNEETTPHPLEDVRPGQARRGAPLPRRRRPLAST